MLKIGLKKLNIPTADRLLQQFNDYISLLIKWNKTYNLTSITEPNEIIVRHILDSLAIVPYLYPSQSNFPSVAHHLAFIFERSSIGKTQNRATIPTLFLNQNVQILTQSGALQRQNSIAMGITGDRVLDVGSGAGFPGVPLALVLPEKQFVLLDSNIKKIRFLTYLKAQLGITNIEIVHSRVENYRPEEKFACIVTRAFASISEILKMTEHLYQQNGVLLAMKGRVSEDEIKGLKNVIVHRLQVPLLNEERHLICVKGISSDQNNSSN